METRHPSERWQTDGKFFRCGSARIHPRVVTYGPFPGGWPESLIEDFNRMTNAGFNAIRTFEIPSRRLLDAAHACGLKVMGTLMWQQSADFLSQPSLLSSARVLLAEELAPIARHPALAAVYVGNEIPSDLVRWMGPIRVQETLEDLIDLGRKIAPQTLFAYANYPSTEYLEPSNADFTAFNVYLEDPGAFRAYLKRLHHIAGDRPLVISEFGLDSRRNGPVTQAQVLEWAAKIAHEEEAAGFTVYAWSDRWLNGGDEVLDWDFGLTDRAGHDKPALGAMASLRLPPPRMTHRYTVIVCTRNGLERITGCLSAISNMSGEFETVVVDDGSTDGTADHVAEHFPWAKLIRLEPSGLSAARNAGAQAAGGEILAFTDDDCLPDREWLLRLDRIFADPRFAAVGGPNLPQVPPHWREAVTCAAPGAPSHVMLDDTTAEHLPGCNLAVKKSAFHEIGGFDPQFHTAGDDVDFCWRLQAEGHRLGFAPGAFVWHLRRPTIRAFLKQQAGYGKAERLLIRKHPSHFTRSGSAIWQGFIYGGGPIRIGSGSIIYHGPMGLAGYQSVTHHIQPLRAIDSRFNHWRARLMLSLVKISATVKRTWHRQHRLPPIHLPHHARAEDTRTQTLGFPNTSRQELLQQLLDDGWQASADTSHWDLEKDGSRVLLATELGEHGHTRTLMRVIGDTTQLSGLG